MAPSPPTVLLVGPAPDTAALRGLLDDVALVLDEVELDDLAARVTTGAPDVAVVLVAASTDLEPLGPVLRAARATRALAVIDGAVEPQRLIGAGIGGHVSAAVADEQLVDAVVGLFHGEGFVGPEMAQHVLDAHRDGARGALSPTEAEVLGRLADGATVDELADEYAVTARVVRLHAGGPLARLLPT